MDVQSTVATGRARLATMLVFLVCGIGVSAWAPMVPIVKQKLGLDEQELGLLLLLFGGGAIVTMPLVGVIINRTGSRPVILIAGLTLAFILPLLTIITSVYAMALALFIFGAATGCLDVSMNSHAVEVQRLISRPVMSSFHAMFSVGGLAGSVGFGWLMIPGLTPFMAALVIAIVLALLIVMNSNKFLKITANTETSSGPSRFPGTVVLLLGLFCFIFFLTEGAMLDWSAVFLKEYRSFDIAMTGTGYALFSIAMAVMRFSGDRLVHRYGPEKITLGGSILASAGLLMIVMIPGTVPALAGFMLVGLGAANVVPVLFSAAGRSKSGSTALATVTTMGYAGQLAGPALIGFIAQWTSLPLALGMLVIPLLLTGVGFVQGRFGKREF